MNLATPLVAPYSAMQCSSEPRLRADFLKQQRRLHDARAPERLIAHYTLERELTDRLRQASPEARGRMYTEVYRELFTSLPDHPQKEVRRGDVNRRDSEFYQIANELKPNSVFLEIGCGDAAFGFTVAKTVRTVYGLDVTDTLIDFESAPSNFRYLATDGIDIPLPGEKIDFAYSNQVIEHLHPEDAAKQLAEVYRVLKPGARYTCITPSRLTGPHDISCYFDYDATCLHLQEYDYAALRSLFRAAGFRHFSCSVWTRGRQIVLPYWVLRTLEHILLRLPSSTRAALTRPIPIKALFGLNFTALK